jgi:hypothetical protein
MSMHVSTHGGALGRRGDSDPIHFRLLYAVCFAVFLFAAVMQRLLPWTWFHDRSNGARQSVLDQARNAAGICATYAFMA